MKKRLLSILLMCCMVLTLLPVTAYADTLYTVHPVEISSSCLLYTSDAADE